MDTAKTNMEGLFTRKIFCANEQAETDHTATTDGNGEFLFTCDTCDRFLKVPKDATPEEFTTFITAHKEQNEGNISVDAQNRRLAELLGITLAPEKNPVSAAHSAVTEGVNPGGPNQP